MLVYEAKIYTVSEERGARGRVVFEALYYKS
jgi:hypothetical protein